MIYKTSQFGPPTILQTEQELITHSLNPHLRYHHGFQLPMQRFCSTRCGSLALPRVLDKNHFEANSSSEGDHGRPKGLLLDVIDRPKGGR